MSLETLSEIVYLLRMTVEIQSDNAIFFPINVLFYPSIAQLQSDILAYEMQSAY